MDITTTFRDIYSRASDQEAPLSDIKALCFAVDALASTLQLDDPARPALLCVATEIERLVGVAVGLREQVAALAHPGGYPEVSQLSARLNRPS